MDGSVGNLLVRPLSALGPTMLESRKDTPMPRVELDTAAPDFTLPDFSGKPVSLSDFRERAHVLLVFNRGFY